MKISKQEEYGLRILLRITRSDGEEGLNIPQLSELESLSAPYVGKLTRTMRMAGLIKSTRGHKGGYVLAKPAGEIRINEIMRALGGDVFDRGYCDNHTGAQKLCTSSVDCSVRTLWKMIQFSLDHVLEKVTLADLSGTDKNAPLHLAEIILQKPELV